MRYLTRLLLFAVIFMAAGCSLTPKAARLHDFGTAAPTADDITATKPDITVAAPKWLSDTRIRYRLLYAAPTQVRFYILDRWIAPPAELLEQQLESGGKTLNYPLAIRLLDFEQQFDAPDRARALLRFSVAAYSADHLRTIGTHEFRLVQPTNTPDAQGAVTAFAELTRQASKHIQDWLAGLPGN